MPVKCLKCQTDNPDTQKYCGECATPLQPSKDIPVTETIERFRNELKIARMISHKNVCRMFDLGESEGSH